MSLANPLQILQSSDSLVAKYLTSSCYEQLKSVTTNNGYDLQQAIQSNLQNLDSAIGFYAGDADCYRAFYPLLAPIIKDYHGCLPESQSTALPIPEPEASSQWQFLAEGKQRILSTRIRTARNLSAYPFGSLLDTSQRAAVEKDIVAALLSLTDSLAGQYHPLCAMNAAEQQALVDAHYLFKSGDRFLTAAGLTRDWPNHRGIFYNSDFSFLVWVNEEDHLRIISMQKGGDILQVYSRLAQAVQTLASQLSFAVDDKLGVLSSCPTNIGTGLRASVHLRLAYLAHQPEKLAAIAEQFHLQIRGQHGEHSEDDSDSDNALSDNALSHNAPVEKVFDISNRRRLGVSPMDCINDLVQGVNEILRHELQH